MFIDSKIALISSENLETHTQLTKLGVGQNTLDPDDFEFHPIRIRIDDIKYVYQSLTKGLLVVELYDTEGQFMLKHPYKDFIAMVDKYYEPTNN
jgi:hypothetical protein